MYLFCAATPAPGADPDLNRSEHNPHACAQLVTAPSKGLTSSEARQEEAARYAGLCWLRTLSAGGALTRLTLAGLAHDVARVSEWNHQLSVLRELECRPRCGTLNLVKT